MTLVSALATLHEAALSIICDSLARKMQAIIISDVVNARKVRPGWLARNGYLILCLSNNMRNRVLPILAPKMKYHGKLTRFVDKDIILGKRLPQEILNAIHRPAMLYEFARNDYREPILAISGRKRSKRRMIPLMLKIDPNGSRCWIRIDNLVNQLTNNFGNFMISAFKELLPPNTWANIERELDLDGLQIDS